MISLHTLCIHSLVNQVDQTLILKLSNTIRDSRNPTSISRTKVATSTMVLNKNQKEETTGSLLSRIPSSLSTSSSRTSTSTALSLLMSKACSSLLRDSITRNQTYKLLPKSFGRVASKLDR